MVSAQIFGSDAQVEYNGPVDQAVFGTGGDFKSENSNETGVAVFQNGTHGLIVSFGASIVGDTDLEYTGTGHGVKTPDTIGYT